MALSHRAICHQPANQRTIGSWYTTAAPAKAYPPPPVPAATGRQDVGDGRPSRGLHARQRSYASPSSLAPMPQPRRRATAADIHLVGRRGALAGITSSRSVAQRAGWRISSAGARLDGEVGRRTARSVARLEEWGAGNRRRCRWLENIARATCFANRTRRSRRAQAEIKESRPAQG